MNRYLLYFIEVIIIGLTFDRGHVAGSHQQKQHAQLRGIPISKLALYNPNKDFECFDGSRRITFDKVNDDYCDCGDGSDEPGTAACSNGFFFCRNTGHKAKYVFSSRVNDGICDCCDGTDEYNSDVNCSDICDELGREARLEAEKRAELAKEGNKIRLDMINQGGQLRNDIIIQLKKLKVDYEEAEMIKKELQVVKIQAEEKESIAMEKYKPVETSTPLDTQIKANDMTPEEYFKLLDSDESKTITINEIQTRITFDKDGNGIISEEEALYFMGNVDELTFEEYLEKAWPNIKPFLLKEQGVFVPPRLEPDPENLQKPIAKEAELEEIHQQHVGEEEMPEDIDEEEEEVEEEEEEEEEEEGKEKEKEKEKVPEEMVKYDEETQALVDEANAARNEFQKAEKSLNELNAQIKSLEEKMERDYGPDNVFAPLDGECFQYTDMEYIYTLCMYGGATQSSKSGGSDVSLGHWHEWAGPSNNRYSKMKFDRGLTCWNGPARSTIVQLECGKENQLLSVSEPSRCEYAMVFSTPALCNPEVDANSIHDEL